MIYVRALALATVLAVLMAAATFAVSSVSIRAFGVPPEIWAGLMAVGVFIFTLQDRIRNN